MKTLYNSEPSISDIIDENKKLKSALSLVNKYRYLTETQSKILKGIYFNNGVSVCELLLELKLGIVDYDHIIRDDSKCTIMDFNILLDECLIYVTNDLYYVTPEAKELMYYDIESESDKKKLSPSKLSVLNDLSIYIGMTTSEVRSRSRLYASKSGIYNILKKLRKRGFVKKINTIWYITWHGNKYLKDNYND